MTFHLSYALITKHAYKFKNHPTKGVRIKLYRNIFNIPQFVNSPTMNTSSFHFETISSLGSQYIVVISLASNHLPHWILSPSSHSEISCFRDKVRIPALSHCLLRTSLLTVMLDGVVHTGFLRTYPKADFWWYYQENTIISTCIKGPEVINRKPVRNCPVKQTYHSAVQQQELAEKTQFSEYGNSKTQGRPPVLHQILWLVMLT